MHEELSSIASAIKELKQDNNPIKDYLFPVGMAFFSSMLGAGVAYFTLIHQEKNKVQKDRVHSLNDWLLSVEEMLTDLISIKSNYSAGLSDNPIQRTLYARSLIGTSKPIEKDITCLAFVIPNESDIASQAVKWRELPRIRMMVKNYNIVLEMWKKRTEIDRPIKEKLAKEYGEGIYASVVSQSDIFKVIDRSEFVVLVDITEKAIKFTDDLIIEMNDFLEKMPEIGKQLIKKKHITAHGPLVKFSTTHLTPFINRSASVDYSLLAELFGKPEDELVKEYETGYE